MGDYRAVPRDVLPDALSGKETVKKGAEPFEMYYKRQIRPGYFKNMKSNSVNCEFVKERPGFSRSFFCLFVGESMQIKQNQTKNAP